MTVSYVASCLIIFWQNLILLPFLTKCSTYLVQTIVLVAITKPMTTVHVRLCSWQSSKRLTIQINMYMYEAMKA